MNQRTAERIELSFRSFSVETTSEVPPIFIGAKSAKIQFHPVSYCFLNYEYDYNYEDIDYKIPPNLPLPKGGKFPSLTKRGEGRFFNKDFYVLHFFVTPQAVHNRRAVGC